MSFRVYTIVALATCGLLVGLHFLYAKSLRLSCWSGGYSQNAWMAYCNAANYGVYDLDAVWFGTEPEIASNIDNAQILTLSNSRLQSAFSLGGAGDWFADHGYHAYFLGLPGAESGLGEMLWDRFKPHASVVIFDASSYFTGHLGYDAETLISDAKNRREQATELARFQSFHREVCSKVPGLCGRNFSYFKARSDGHWIFPPSSSAAGMWINGHSVPTEAIHYATNSIPEAQTAAPYAERLQAADRIISKLGLPRRCIIMTEVPSAETDSGLDRFLATRLGVTLIDPNLSGMTTFDHAHLSPQSARAWTAVFLKELDPVLRACVAKGELSSDPGLHHGY